jgi:hypothetical protein
MLITINGEADNGKDFVADWLCERFNLVKIGLADPIKRFLRHLFGFPVENLWGPSSVRNEEIDATPLWRTALSQLHTMHEFTVAIIPQSYGLDLRAQAFLGLQNWFTQLRKSYPEKLSARVALQTLGTEWGRTMHPDIWINYLFDKQLMHLAKGYVYTPTGGIQEHLGPQEVKDGICIPDQRFQNELDAAIGKGAYTIRVRRLSRHREKRSNVGISGHVSETEQRKITDQEFNKVFEFPEGLDAVRQMLWVWACTEERFANVHRI